MLLVTIEIKGDLAEVRFAFNPVAIKCVREIPGRLYRPEVKHWTVPSSSVNHLESLLRHQGFEVEVTSNSSDWAEAVLRRVGCDEAMYRKLTRVFHPDTGGDTRMQQELNDARRRCCGRR